MTKLCCVPEEMTEKMLDAVRIGHPLGEGETGMLLRRLNRERWTTMLATAPPLPPDIEAALELAQTVSYYQIRKVEYDAIKNALLKSHGKLP